MAGPQGWVSPAWPSLSRRPLILGLPYGPAFTLILLTVYGIAVWRLVAPSLVAAAACWLIGVAVTRYDQFGFELLFGAMRMPARLRAC